MVGLIVLGLVGGGIAYNKYNNNKEEERADELRKIYRGNEFIHSPLYSLECISKNIKPFAHKPIPHETNNFIHSGGELPKFYKELKDNPPLNPSTIPYESTKDKTFNEWLNK